MTTTLPSKPSPEWLASFWLTLSFAGGLLAGAAVWLVGSGAWIPTGSIAFALLTLIGAIRPRIASALYRSWNRLAQAYSEMAGLLLNAICFYTVVVAVGRGGSTFKLDRSGPESSGWVPRGTLPPRAYGSLDAAPIDKASTGWLRGFFSWLGRDGHAWVVGLVPFPILLKAVEVEAKQDTSSDIYPLY